MSVKYRVLQMTDRLNRHERSGEKATVVVGEEINKKINKRGGGCERDGWKKSLRPLRREPTERT